MSYGFAGIAAVPGLCRAGPGSIAPAGGLRVASSRGAHTESQARGQDPKELFF